MILGVETKPKWKENLEYIGFCFALFGIPAILYLAIKKLPGNFGGILVFLLYFFVLWLVFDKYHLKIKRLKRELRLALKHSDYSPEEKKRVMEESEISQKDD